MKTFISLFLLLSGCGPSSSEDFRVEGEAQTKLLIEELRQIQNRDALQAAAPRLKRRFAKFGELILAAHLFLKTHSPEFLETGRVSEELFSELARIYELPGGRELIELAQEETRLFLRQEMGLSSECSERGTE